MTKVKASAGKEQLSDADLLRLAGKHDEEAFLILYRRHQGPVFRFALHMSGSRETAEEVTQEVFLAMLAKRRGYVLDRGSCAPTVCHGESDRHTNPKIASVGR